MKGLLGINYSQHLADEDGLESDQEGDDKSHIFFYYQKKLFVPITGGLVLGQSTAFCLTMISYSALFER